MVVNKLLGRWERSDLILSINLSLGEWLCAIDDSYGTDLINK